MGAQALTHVQVLPGTKQPYTPIHKQAPYKQTVFK